MSWLYCGCNYRYEVSCGLCRDSSFKLDLRLENSSTPLEPACQVELVCIVNCP